MITSLLTFASFGIFGRFLRKQPSIPDDSAVPVYRTELRKLRTKVYRYEAVPKGY